MKTKYLVLAAVLAAAPAFASQQGDFKHNSITVDPVSLLGGNGLNLQLERSFSPKLSALIGAGFNGFGSNSVNSYGLTAGADFFLTQGHNEGLRVGPRLLVGLSNASDGRTGAFEQNVVGYRHAVGAEAGYNWISAHGITLGAAAGVNYGFWGNGSQTSNFSNGGSTGGTSGTGGYGTTATGSSSSNYSLSDRLNPYVAVNAGFSW